MTCGLLRHFSGDESFMTGPETDFGSVDAVARPGVEIKGGSIRDNQVGSKL